MATMQIIIFERNPKRPLGPHKFNEERPISEELPADALGEFLAEAIEATWKNGIDPTVMEITIRFS